MKWKGQYLLCSLLALVTSASEAIDVNAEFSADAEQRAPGRPVMQARMYVSKEAVRTEFEMGGQQMVEILFPQQARRVMLMPAQKTYMEQTGAIPPNTMTQEKSRKSPCEGRAGTNCKNLGMETINGRKAEKWEMTVSRNGQTLRSLHWLDTKRRIPLREQFPDGTIVEMTIAGNEKINGRNTEKWQLQINRADGRSMQSTQWYDPELKIVIREELPGGYLRELTNIKVGKQNQKLFVIPEGYQKRPSPGAQPRAPMPNARY